MELSENDKYIIETVAIFILIRRLEVMGISDRAFKNLFDEYTDYQKHIVIFYDCKEKEKANMPQSSPEALSLSENDAYIIETISIHTTLDYRLEKNDLPENEVQTLQNYTLTDYQKKIIEFYNYSIDSMAKHIAEKLGVGKE